MISVRVGTAAAAVAVALTACGGADSLQASPGASGVDSGRQQKAQDLCQGAGMQAAREYDPNATLEAAQPTTGAAFARFETRDRGPGAPRGAAAKRTSSPENMLALCYFGGTFTSFPTPPSKGEDRPYDLIGLTVDEAGTTTMYVAAHSARYDTEDKPAEQ